MRRNRATSMRRLTAGAAVAGICVLAACEGSNLFGVAGAANANVKADAQSPTVTIQAPATGATKHLGDSVFVQALLQDNVGVGSVRMYGVAERGDKDLGTAESVARFEEKDITFRAGLRDTTVMRYLIPTADSTRETV
jgi:hypothetical protein